MRRFVPPLLIALLALATCAGPTGPAIEPRVAAGCSLTQVAEVPLRVTRNFLLAPVRLDGHFAQMVVDTGAETSTLTPSVARRLRLAYQPDHGMLMLGISGPFRSTRVRAASFTVGDLERVDPSFGLIQMPPFPGQSPPVVGLLGADLLAGHEVDLDAPAGLMRLYAAQDCERIVPWPGGVVVPVARTRSGLVFVDAVVNGVTVRALLDTGARTTLIAHAVAARLGVTQAMLTHDPVRIGMGIGRGDITVRQHRFATIGLPGALAHDMIANVGDLRLPGVAMLLGADYLGQREIWISYTTNRLFLR